MMYLELNKKSKTITDHSGIIAVVNVNKYVALFGLNWQLQFCLKRKVRRDPNSFLISFRRHAKQISNIFFLISLKSEPS